MKLRTVWIIAATLLAALPPFAATATADDASGVAAWSKIVGVLQHPRCMNCHQATAPLQGDAAQAHVPFVQRGADGTGMGDMRCGVCHKDAGNDSMSGTPGAPHWRLAPVAMVWQGLSSPELCTLIKDPKRNGGRDGAGLVEHMNVEPLVLWGWAPGKDRTPVPLAHKDFVALMRAWVAAGMPCPK
jgi:mono/diheme cytochrome c family protein